MRRLQSQRSTPKSPYASSGETECGTSGGGRVGNGCVGDSTSSGTPSCGTGRSSTGKTGTPVSRCRTKSIPIFVAWIDDRNLAVRPRNRREERLRRDVVVPDVVVHGLEAPDELAGRSAQREHGAAELVHLAVVAAPVVEHRVAGRDEHEAARLVDGEGRPGVRGAEGVALRARVLARPHEAVRREVARPAQRAAAHVERADDAARRVLPLVVAHRRADDDEVSDDRRRRGHLILTAPALLAGGGVQVDGASAAEASAARCRSPRRSRRGARRWSP